MWWALQIDVAIGLVGTLVLSAALVSNGAITLGTAFLLFQYVHLMIRPLEELADQLEVIQKANGAMHRVVELLAIEPTVVDGGTTSPPPGPLRVTCTGVGFAYDEVQSILHDVEVEISGGRSVGVVGRTGSGKTTFSRLLLRLVEATHGCVALGGVPIADIPLTELRRRVALVPQEVELFEGTIRDNVTLFDPEPTDTDVEQALRHVGLDALVDTGIDRPLGSGGAGLSAGQAQLLALARVWLRNPDLVVLDEATARVDPETERRIAAAIAELMKGRTTFVIAHRLSTLDMVDEVIVFDHGRIAEHGDRTALVDNRDSRFRHLLELALAVESDTVGEEIVVHPFDDDTEDPTLHRVEADVDEWRSKHHWRRPRSLRATQRQRRERPPAACVAGERNDGLRGRGTHEQRICGSLPGGSPSTSRARSGSAGCRSSSSSPSRRSAATSSGGVSTPSTRVTRRRCTATPACSASWRSCGWP